MSYNSKYTGAEVEAILDSVGSAKHYVITSFTIEDLQQYLDSWGENSSIPFDDIEAVGHAFAAKRPVYVRAADTEYPDIYPMVGHFEGDQWYFRILCGTVVWELEVYGHVRNVIEYINQIIIPTQFKTINGQSVLGSGDISVSESGSSIYIAKFSVDDLNHAVDGSLPYLDADTQELEEALSAHKIILLKEDLGEYEDYYRGYPGIITGYAEDLLYLNILVGTTIYTIETERGVQGIPAGNVSSHSVLAWEDVSTVAISGDYNDLKNKPTIPAAVTDSSVTNWGFAKKSYVDEKFASVSGGVKFRGVYMGLPEIDSMSSPNEDGSYTGEWWHDGYLCSDTFFVGDLIIVSGVQNSDGYLMEPSYEYILDDTESPTWVPLGTCSIAEQKVVALEQKHDQQIGQVNTNKQDRLVSGTNIKTINGTSILGSGDITISGSGTITEVKANGTSIATSGVANIPAASTSAYGVTKLTSSTSSTSTTLAATASAVKSAYDLANSYKGTVTGVKVNGTTKSPSSGTVDIGNVVTSVKVNGNTYSPSSGVVDLGTISGGGESTPQYYVIQSFYFDDIISNSDNGIFGYSYQNIGEIEQITNAFNNKIPVYINRNYPDDGYISMIPVTGFSEDLLYLTIVEGDTVLTIEASVNSEMNTEEYSWHRYSLSEMQSQIGGGESSGGSSSGGGAYSEVNHGTSDTTFTLTPNTFHIWDEVGSLDLDLGAETGGVANEYLFQFTSGSEPTSLSLPDDIKWANNTPPTISANKIYQISILNNLAVCLEFDNAPELIENKLSITNSRDIIIITSQYPVASDIKISFVGKAPGLTGSLTLQAGSSEVQQTGEKDPDWEMGATITGVLPSSDTTYLYTF